jgi:hypothetical protein
MESRGRTSSRGDRESIANGLRTVGGLSGGAGSAVTMVATGRVAMAQVVVDTVAITAMVVMMGAATEIDDECVSRHGPIRGARGRFWLWAGARGSSTRAAGGCQEYAPKSWP